MDKEIRAYENKGQYILSTGRASLNVSNIFTKEEFDVITRLINLPKKIEEIKNRPLEGFCGDIAISEEAESNFNCGYYKALEELQTYIDKGDE